MLFANKSPPPILYASRLLPDLFAEDTANQDTVISVADFGPARASTISFLNQFRCKLQVIDIIDQIKKINQVVRDEPDIAPGELVDEINRALPLNSGVRFDVCLFWDVFNYQDLRLVAAFGEALSPYLAPDFVGHGFAVLNRSNPLWEQNYSIVDRNSLQIQPLPKAAELPYKHSQSAINGVLKGLSIRQSVLREDGRLEFLIRRA